MTLLAVYGTLREGCKNSDHLRGCRFIGLDVLDLGGGRLKVEVYEVGYEALARIHDMETTPPNCFERREMKTEQGRDVIVYLWAGGPS